MILRVRDRYGWGPRKIHAYLSAQGHQLPSIRTLGNVLKRHGRIGPKPTTPPETIEFFERSQPHELWQCDFKAPLEVQRRRVHLFSVLDDHSRFLLAVRPCLDKTMNTAFAILWEAFGPFGMPQAILCDNAFGTMFSHSPGVSWFEAQLIRLGIRALHGRAHHPQTQGKVERLHGTFQRELWPYVRRDTIEHFDQDVNRWRVEVYNTLRPHEALGDQPPLARFGPSPRPRPETLPPVEYPLGCITRKVQDHGKVRWKGCRILVGGRPHGRNGSHPRASP